LQPEREWVGKPGELSINRMNSFEEDLKYSLKNGNDWINNFYWKKFKHHGLKEIIEVKDAERQKKGIDKILKFDNDNELWLDEKKRREDYGDFLLEEYSNKRKRTLGWLNKTKMTDYIAYICMPTKKIYLLPFMLLQLAWIKNYSQWKKIYGIKKAKNDGYITTNIPVPKEELFRAIREEMDCNFN